MATLVTEHALTKQINEINITKKSNIKKEKTFKIAFCFFGFYSKFYCCLIFLFISSILYFDCFQIDDIFSSLQKSFLGAYLFYLIKPALNTHKTVSDSIVSYIYYITNIYYNSKQCTCTYLINCAVLP